MGFFFFIRSEAYFWFVLAIVSDEIFLITVLIHAFEQ